MFALCFRPWTHTSDDSYIYQLSLDLATATVSSEGTLVGAPSIHGGQQLRLREISTEVMHL